MRAGGVTNALAAAAPGGVLHVSLAHQAIVATLRPYHLLQFYNATIVDLVEQRCALRHTIVCFTTLHCLINDFSDQCECGVAGCVEHAGRWKILTLTSLKASPCARPRADWEQGAS